jgi:hypothetical protein
MELAPENTPDYSHLVGQDVVPFTGWFGTVIETEGEMVKVSFYPDSCVGTYSGKFIEESLTASLSKPDPLEKSVEIAVGTEVEIWEGGNPDRAHVGKVTERIRERMRSRSGGEDGVILDMTPHNIYRVDFPFNEETRRSDGPWGSPFWEYRGEFLQDKVVQNG